MQGASKKLADFGPQTAPSAILYDLPISCCGNIMPLPFSSWAKMYSTGIVFGWDFRWYCMSVLQIHSLKGVAVGRQAVG